MDWRDGAVIGLASILGLASWTLPEVRWPNFAGRLARYRIKRRMPLSEAELALIRIITGDQPVSWIEKDYWPEALAEKYLSWMYILACHRPGGRRLKTLLIGGENVDKALEAGRGAVLFTATFIHKDLMAKAAFAQAGYEICHLSRDTHGFSETRFGKRWLNPVYTRIEERYLRERMVFSGSNTRDVSTRLRQRLSENAPVMITVTPLGRRVAVLPFLHGRIHIASGGLSIASESQAPVLPVFTVGKHEGVMTTIVGPALDQPEGADRRTKIDAMLRDYVPRLEDHVRHNPTQFSFPLSDQFGKALISPAAVKAESARPDDRRSVA